MACFVSDDISDVFPPLPYSRFVSLLRCFGKKEVESRGRRSGVTPVVPLSAVVVVDSKRGKSRAEQRLIISLVQTLQCISVMKACAIGGYLILIFPIVIY